MRKLRKGDDVIILSGKDKGKIGSILNFLNYDYVLIQGINIVKKHQKPNPANGNAGGIINKEVPIHISNIAIYNYNLKKSDRVGFKTDVDKSKVRIYKSTGEVIES